MGFKTKMKLEKFLISAPLALNGKVTPCMSQAGSADFKITHHLSSESHSLPGRILVALTHPDLHREAVGPGGPQGAKPRAGTLNSPLPLALPYSLSHLCVHLSFPICLPCESHTSVLKMQTLHPNPCILSQQVGPGVASRAQVLYF